MRQADGRLFATSRGGRSHLNAYLDDYAFVIAGLIELYQADFDPRWLREALALNAVLEAEFRAEDGGYFTTGDSHEELLIRSRSGQDGSMPSGLGVQALNLLRLGELTGSPALLEAGSRALASVGTMANRFPVAFSMSLVALDFQRARPREVVVAGEADWDSTRALLAVLRDGFRPHQVVALADQHADAKAMPLLEGKLPESGAARAFVCRSFTCEAPILDPTKLAEELARP
ncbi:MAG: hypothetical protein P1V81_11330 [Planctomycetota bacterium]|nr:hypothetical protein [Planctomycetota bacterium]